MSAATLELRGVALFDQVPAERLEVIAAAAEELRLESGEALFEQGTHGTHFFVLLEGELSDVKEEGGEEVVAFNHSPGSYIGAVMLVTKATYPTTSRATRPSRLLRWDEEGFALMRREPSIEDAFMQIFASAYATLESASRQREKLAALGGLGAGLAHELNNPAAAARSAAADLRSTVATLEGAAARFVELGMAPGQIADLVRLRSEVAGAARDGEAGVDALERGAREDELADWLDEQGVADPWTLAPELAGGGIDVAWAERVRASTGGAALGEALAWAAAGLRAGELLDQIDDATGRVGALVDAVRNYSYMDQAPSQDIDVHEGLDSTLTMLGHKLKKGSVEVRRDYDRGLPRITAYGSELNQVWTNLIDNAVHAVAGDGTVTVRTCAGGGERVLVEIGDDGPGIPEQDRARVFEPFFTTKGVGEGTGLGLDTARRIVVNRHHGSIDIESRPGDTRVRVRLPVHPVVDPKETA